MNERYLKAGDLMGFRVLTTDRGRAALRDLVVDASAWAVPYLAVDAEAWAPGHDVLVAARSVAEVDEAAREVDVDLSFEQVRNSPSLPGDAPVTRDFEENWYRYYGWEEQWQVEASTVDASEPPEPVSPPAEEPLPAEVNASGPGLVRFEDLRQWQGVTRDGHALRVRDLLVDDKDWSAAFLEVDLYADGEAVPCLVEWNLVAALDPVAERLDLNASAERIRGAPRRVHPGAGDDRELPLLEEEGP